MRILVTNDDGVHAPGLAAIVRALAKWASDRAANETREVVVVAPMANHSGASAAVGTVFEREAIAYRRSVIEGAEEIPTFGLDASPALSVIVGALEGFGPKPDLVVSGINLGVNVGRSVLHSGTVGAVLTGAQLGLSGLAVSMRSGADVEHWETPANLAVALLPWLGGLPARSVLNLNSPSVPLHELKGVRRGRISTVGIIKGVVDRRGEQAQRVRGGPAAEGDAEGEIVLNLGAAVPSLGDVGDEEPDEDGALVAAGFASLTPVVGVREAAEPATEASIGAALIQLEASLNRR